VRVPLGQKVRLADFDADHTGGIQGKRQAKKELRQNVAAPAEKGPDHLVID
jgi:hypothetical protein